MAATTQSGRYSAPEPLDGGRPWWMGEEERHHRWLVFLALWRQLARPNTANRLVRHNSILIYICNLLKDTFLQWLTTKKERKNKCDWKHSVFTNKLEGSHIAFWLRMPQKSRDSILLIGARVFECAKKSGASRHPSFTSPGVDLSGKRGHEDPNKFSYLVLVAQHYSTFGVNMRCTIWGQIHRDP
jgi:hypothetical protein